MIEEVVTLFSMYHYQLKTHCSNHMYRIFIYRLVGSTLTYD